MSGHGDAHVRLRAGWTALVVLIAVGCGSPAVPPTQIPSVPASPTAQPSLAVSVERLGAVLDATSDVADAGRGLMEELQALDLEAVERSIDDGDAAAAALEETLLEGATSGAAIAAVATVPSRWHALAARAGTVSDTVDALQRHDQLVFEATAAGREARWKAALELLEQAGVQLSVANATRDGLSAAGDADVATLAEVIDRYEAYDAALVALYRHERRTGRQEGGRFERLLRRVERTQSALPTDNAVLSVIVSELAGSSLTEAVIAIEGARDQVREALPR